MIHIIIPVYNRLSLTRTCLTALERQTERQFRVLVVDDGSTDGTADAVEAEFGRSLDITILTGSGSLYWGGGVEHGMRKVLEHGADTDFVLTLNNDVRLSPTFLRTAMALVARFPDSVIGAISSDNWERGEVGFTGWRMVSWPLALTKRVWWPMTVAEIGRLQAEVADVDFLPGSAVIIPVGLIRKAGPVNGSLLPHYHADSEFSWRVKQHGGRVLIARDLRIAHELAATGLAGNDTAQLTIPGLLRSFGTIRSGNCLKYKWRFARLSCPLWAIPSFMLFDTIKVLIRGLALCVSSGMAKRLKHWTNPG